MEQCNSEKLIIAKVIKKIIFQATDDSLPCSGELDI
jgi:hypothetical protein